MNDQKQHWNKKHLQGDVDHYVEEKSNFANEVLKIIKPQSKILELGCGVGNDAALFAKAGYKVTATDFSEIAIKKNQSRYKNIQNLTFEILDLNYPLRFVDKEFNVVYAMLSLHYFTDEKTKKIFKEIFRILKQDGLLCFVCKSTNDHLFGKGFELEKDMFENEGHIRHFFSRGYVKDCLDGKFEILKLEEGEEKFYSIKAAFIKVIAKVKK